MFQKLMARFLVLISSFGFGGITYGALPPVNLGHTSFMDGVAGPGTLVEQSFIQYKASEFIDSDKNDIAEGDLTTTSLVTLIAHISDVKVMGAYYGAEILIPTVNVDFNLFGDEETSGLGDISVSPLILQWPSIEYWGVNFSQRLNLNVSLPTGKYKSRNNLNIGSNTYIFNPHYAATLQFTPRIETSLRFHYLWNGENDNPTEQSGFDTTQAGQAIHVNFAGSYMLSQQLRAGLSSYYLTQVTEQKINGISQDDSKESVFAIGGGLLFKNSLVNLHLNAYRELEAKNRTKGERFVFKLSKVF